ncbi:hypothetical protein LTR67_002229 [Exophiala xenobiotica]|nr:hypothetical protein LTR06_008384 [Exophiala xenobiotica]
MQIDDPAALPVDEEAGFGVTPDPLILCLSENTAQSITPVTGGFTLNAGTPSLESANYLHTPGISRITTSSLGDSLIGIPHGILSTHEVFPPAAMHVHDGGVPTDFLDDFIAPTDFGTWFEDANEFNSADAFGIFLPEDTVDVADSSMLNAVSILRDQLPHCVGGSSSFPHALDGSGDSASPQLSVYDNDVLNILLNVAKRHLSPTFVVFAEFQARSSDRIEVVLAMAAVGSLYSAVPESTKIAKMLYNDARRLLLEHCLCEVDHSFPDLTSFAKTFMLLEIYGICSGDKRAYEFIEFFHGNKTLVIARCMDVLAGVVTSEQRHQIQLVLQAAKVLDSYRVLILRRPPSFVDEIMAGMESKDPDRLQSARGPCGKAVDSTSAQWHDLTKEISLSWMASFGDGETSSPPFWKVEFAELALHRWLSERDVREQDETPVSASQMMLFHLTQVLLHTAMRTLRRYACTAVHSAAPLSKLPRTPETSPQPWANRYRYKKAMWHANAILRLADDAMTPWRRHNSSSMQCLSFAEPPHLSFCIFFATLVAWYGDIRERAKDPRAGDSVIDTACRLLLTLKAPVSESLKAMLQQLSSFQRDQEKG